MLRQNGKPAASQGIGHFEGVNLLLGLKQFIRGRDAPEPGNGQVIAEYVVAEHSNQPIIGFASSDMGEKLFKRIGFNQVDLYAEDLPIEVKSAIEVALDRSDKDRSLRKLYLRNPAGWWVMIKLEAT